MIILDARFRTTLPLVNAEILLQRENKKENHIQNRAANVYKRELVKEIKTAYITGNTRRE
jgi:hypothetical protein